MPSFFRHTLTALLLSSASVALVSCAVIGRNAKEISEDFKGFSGFGEDEKSQSAPKNISEMMPVNSMSELYGEDKIVWADENPDVEMGGLEELWKIGPQDNWFESYTDAMRVARKEGKPVLMWFSNTNPKSPNPTNQALDEELFSTGVFETWAAEKVVRLRVDSNIREEDQHKKVKKREYVNDLKKRYKVHGSPVVIMLSPRGASFGKYIGYKSGDASFYHGRLKSAYRNAMTDYGKWREEYQAKGYRVWHDSKGRKVFAKPRSLKGNTLYLIDPDGKKSKTSLSKLSQEDRTWVLEYQKKKAASRR